MQVRLLELWLAAYVSLTLSRLKTHAVVEVVSCTFTFLLVNKEDNRLYMTYARKRVSSVGFQAFKKLSILCGKQTRCVANKSLQISVSDLILMLQDFK